MLETISVLTAAQEYVLRGWSVIPLRPHDKRPLIEWKDYQQRLPTSEELQSWFKDGTANIGIVTGKISNLVGIDVDGADGLESAKTLKTLLPATRIHKTPRGYHMLYRYTPELHTGAAFAPGLDVRSEGGYLVAPPSEVGGIRYIAMRDGDPVELLHIPEILKAGQRSRNGSAPISDAPKWVSDALANGGVKGARNDLAARLAGYFHSKGLAEDIVLTILQDYAAKCNPAMSDDEVRAVVKSVGRYALSAKALGIDTPPEFEQCGTALVFKWANGVRVQFDRLHEDKEGVYSEIVVTSAIPGLPTHLHGPARYNLTSTQGRNSLVAYLKKRVEEADWAQILEHASRLAVTIYREGAPVQNLAHYTMRAKSKWCLKPFVLEGQMNVLYGDGGTFKSTLALVILASIQTGIDYLGIAPEIKHNGLYLDWEDEAETHGERLNLFNIEATLPDIQYRRMYGTLADQVDQVHRIVDQYKIGFLVIDSAALACGNEPEKAEPVVKLTNAVRSLGVTTLLIAHINKGGGLYGNVHWRNQGRNVWETRKQQEAGENRAKIGLFHRKANSIKLEKPHGYTISFLEGACEIRQTDVLDAPELAAGAGLLPRMKALLDRGQRLTVEQIAEELADKQNNIRSMLNQYKGVFQSRGGDPKLWELCTHQGGDYV